MGIARSSVSTQAHSKTNRVPNAELGRNRVAGHRRGVVLDTALARHQFVTDAEVIQYAVLSGAAYFADV